MRNQAWIALALSVGCEFSIPSGRFACVQTADCPPNQRCDDGLCVSTGRLDAAIDAGGDDAQTCPLRAFHPDRDGDGYGDRTTIVMACEAPAGMLEDGSDCDDDCADCHPDGRELCNNQLDEDCVGWLDNGCPCAEGPRACGTSNGECTPGFQACEDGVWGACDGAEGPSAEVCNGLDDDCDGTVDGALADAACPSGANVDAAYCSTSGCVMECAAGFIDCTEEPGCETRDPGNGVCPLPTVGAVNVIAWSLRRPFYAMGRHWAFFGDDDLQYATSTDGRYWTAPTVVEAGLPAGWTAIHSDGTFVHYVSAPEVVGEPAEYRRGRLRADGTIEWSAKHVAATPNSGRHLRRAAVTVDGAGRAAVFLHEANASGGLYGCRAAASSANDGTWVSYDGFPQTLNSGALTWAGEPLRLGDGTIHYIYCDGTQYCYGRTYAEGVLGTARTIGSTFDHPFPKHLPAVVYQNEIHATGRVQTGEIRHYVLRDGEWRTLSPVSGASRTDPQPDIALLDSSTGDLGAIWTAEDQIFFRVGRRNDDDAYDWSEPTLCYDGSATGLRSVMAYANPVDGSLWATALVGRSEPYLLSVVSCSP